MDDNNMYVSIVMAEYNTNIEQFNSSINSILNQTYKYFELIIIDDNGKNDVQKLIDKFNDDRIVVYKNEENKGLAESLNIGINKAKYKYIIRMDTDDIALPDRIEKQVKFASLHPEYSLIAGRYILFNEKGDLNTSTFSGEVKKEDFLFGTPFAHPTLLIKKEDILASGGYPDYRRCQDYAMEMQLYSNGYKGYVMDEILLKYRQDINGYKKKKYKTRIIEYKVRKKYFRKLGFPIYRRFLYEIKPIIIGLIPLKIQKFYHENINT